MYNSIRSTNFIYFLLEIEFLRSIKMLPKEDKINNLAISISARELMEKKILDENELLDLNYETMYENEE